MLVYLNPGHDRDLDSGAVNRHSGARECDKAYELTMKLKALLGKKGVDTCVDQRDDLYDLCDAANETGADIFVSIHFNAFNEVATGTETLISSSPASLILGHCIQSHVRAALMLPDRGLKERMDLLVLRGTIMPAVLVEICFIDNDKDLYRYEAHVDQVARALCEGIWTYITQAATNAA